LRGRNPCCGQISLTKTAETELRVKGFKKPFPGIFIRAPSIEKTLPGVDVLAEFRKKPVMVIDRKRKVLATTFHPELTNDARIHKLFIGMAKN